MKSLFKISKQNTHFESPKSIPSDFFQYNTHCFISTFSRLSPSFEQMLSLCSARQMFLRYLQKERRQDLLILLRQLLISSNGCDEKCIFNQYVINLKSTENIDEIIDWIKFRSNNNDVEVYLKKLECHLERYSHENESAPCHFISIYVKYFSIVASQSPLENSNIVECLKDSRMYHKMLVEIYTEPHQKSLSTFQVLQKDIYDSLCKIYHQSYVQSIFYRHYQLQLLNSGLNSLHLSDFLYSNEYIMIITEFLELKGLPNYLRFLLAIINLGGTNGTCTFNDALDVYSTFLVMDSSHFIGLPADINNCVVNQMCQIKNSTDLAEASRVNINIFECAFRPVYLFLEQYWFPQFLAWSTFHRNVNRLSLTVQTNSVRHRNHSDGIYNARKKLVNVSQTSEDLKQSDVSADNTSVRSEPNFPLSPRTGSTSESIDINPEWWPSKSLEDTFSSPIFRPMSLGNFDDLGRYRSFASSQFPGMPNSTSSELLSTISELGSDLWKKFQVNTPSTATIDQSRAVKRSPDELARQIINDVHEMTFRN